MSNHEDNAVKTDELKLRALVLVERVEARLNQLVKLAIETHAANPEITKEQAQPILDAVAECETTMYAIDKLVSKFPQKVFTEGELFQFNAELETIANEY